MKPVQSFRLEPRHRDLVKAVIARLDAGDEDAVRSALEARPVGPFKDAAAALNFLINRLVTMLRPDQIWLFGSRARGDHHHQSDFDLLVVLPDGRVPESYSYEAVAEPLLACGVPYDVVPISRADFEAAEPADGTLAGIAKLEGRRLYASRRLRRKAA